MIKLRPIAISMVVVGLIFLVNVLFCHSLVCPVVLLTLLTLIYISGVVGVGLWGYLLLGVGYGVGLVSCYLLVVEMRGEVGVELHNLGGLSWRTLLFFWVYSSLGAVMVVSGIFIVRRFAFLRGCGEGVRYLGVVGVLSVGGTIFMVSGGVVTWGVMPSWVACVVLWAYFVIVVGVVLGVIFSLSGVRICRNYGRGSLAHRYRVVVFLLVVGVVGVVMALILGCVSYGWDSERDFLYGYVVGVVVGVSSVVLVLLLVVMSLWFGRLLPRMARFRCGETLHSEREWQAKARSLSHDIRNPLTPIKLKLQMLRCGVCHKNSTVVLDELLEQVDMLSSVVEGGGSEQRIDVVTLVAGVVSLYSSYSGVKFTTRGLSGYYIRTSRVILWRVLINVVQNSVEAMGGEGEVLIDIFEEGKSLIISVEDSGGGISDELLASIFLSGVSTKGAGRGLGLALCRDLLASIGGTIELSRGSRGTVAAITLPSF